jgi:cell shape-determining protein MreC
MPTILHIVQMLYSIIYYVTSVHKYCVPDNNPKSHQHSVYYEFFNVKTKFNGYIEQLQLDHSLYNEIEFLKFNIIQGLGENIRHVIN